MFNDLILCFLSYIGLILGEPWISNVLGDQIQNSLFNSAPPLADTLRLVALTLLKKNRFREGFMDRWHMPDSVVDGVIGVTADALADFVGYLKKIFSIR